MKKNKYLFRINKLKASSLLIAVLIITSLSIIGVMLIQGVGFNIKNIDNFNVKSQTYNESEKELNNVVFLWNINPVESNVTSSTFLNTIYNWQSDTSNVVSFEQIGEIQLNNLEGENIDVNNANSGQNRRIVYRINTVGRINGSNISTTLESILTYNYN